MIIYNFFSKIWTFLRSESSIFNIFGLICSISGHVGHFQPELTEAYYNLWLFSSPQTLPKINLWDSWDVIELPISNLTSRVAFQVIKLYQFYPFNCLHRYFELSLRCRSDFKLFWAHRNYANTWKLPIGKLASNVAK